MYGEIIRPQLTGITVLTDANSPQRDTHPTWATDGQSILFESNRNGETSLFEFDLAVSASASASSNIVVQQQAGPTATPTGANQAVAEGHEPSAIVAQASPPSNCFWGPKDNAVFRLYPDQFSAFVVAVDLANHTTINNTVTASQLDRILDMGTNSTNAYYTLGQSAAPLIYNPSTFGRWFQFDSTNPETAQLLDIDETTPTGDWIILSYGGLDGYPECEPPGDTDITEFTVDTVIDVSNLFELNLDNNFYVQDTNDPSIQWVNSHPLYTFFSTSFTENYILGLDDFRSEIVESCPSDQGGDPTDRTALSPCGEQIYLQYLWQHNNRFNDEILSSAQTHGVPPLLLKLVLIQESMLIPSLTPNTGTTTGAIGIAQMVEATGTGQMVLDGRAKLNDANRNPFLQFINPNLNLPAVNSLTNFRTYHNYQDGFTGDADILNITCGNPIVIVGFADTSSNQTTLCQDHYETLLAIDDAAYYLDWLYGVLSRRISNSAIADELANSVQQEQILWTWVTAAYNRGINYYGATDLNFMDGYPNISASDICDMQTATPVIPETNRYVGAILAGRPQHTTIAWCSNIPL